ncbi:MAG: hypothetical protein JJ909_07125 [Roseivirga sp.]|nr:hypothetical protein [Roseivirga sp.]
MTAAVQSIAPDLAMPGDRFYIKISGDAFTGVTNIDLGEGITVNSFKVLNDGEMSARIMISEDALLGARDLTIIHPSGQVSLPAIFSVVSPP